VLDVQGIASPRQRVKQAGISLVETLVALALGMSLVSVAFNLYVSNRSVFQQIEAMTRLQESASIAAALLETDIRHAAGVLCRNDAPLTNLLKIDDSANYVNFANGLKGYFASVGVPDQIVSGKRCAGDSLSIYSTNTSDIARVTASATQTATSYTFTVADASKFSKGDVALACDYDRAVLFQVTESGGGTLKFDTTTSLAPGNCGVKIKAIAPASSGTVALPRCTTAQYAASAAPYTFGPGSMIGKLRFTHWYIGTKNNGKTCKLPSNGNPVHNLALHRVTAAYNQTKMKVASSDDYEMVENVSDMTIEGLLGDTNGSGYPGEAQYKIAFDISEANWARVIAVRMRLTLTSPEGAGLAAGNVASAPTYTIPIYATVRARMPGIVRR
jgi:Tfp pilus assembly protein PilW